LFWFIYFLTIPFVFCLYSKVLKEEPEDLTHLAPVAGDSCIPLDMPSIAFPSDLFDVEQLTPEFFDCLPLTGFDIPLLIEPEELIEADDNGAIEPVDFTAPPVSIKKEDPFIFFDGQSGTPLVNSSSNLSSPMPSIVSIYFFLNSAC
jgi:hypothetical protein